MRIFVCHDYLPDGRELEYETTVAAEQRDNIHVHEGVSEAAFVAMRSARDETLGMPTLIFPSLQVNMRAGHFPPAQEGGQVLLNIPINAFGGEDIGALTCRGSDVMTDDIKQVTEQFSVSAQLTTADVKALASRGIKSLICNRPDGEAADQPNVAEIDTAATEAGIAMAYLPVEPGQFSSKDVSEFLAALQRLPSPVHAFCRTGTRSISLWALAQRRMGAESEALLDIASAHGYDLSSALETVEQTTAAHLRAPNAAHYDILIVGAGAAGIAAASSLLARVKGAVYRHN